MKILIVEDDENSRVLLESALASNGYHVKSAVNGKIALQSALNEPPDMIVSDILMPEMDGYELCREIKSNNRLRKIPFVFYSATFTDPKDERLAMDLGAVKFIVKPMEIDQLLKEIDAVLQNVKNLKISTPDKSLKDVGELQKDYSKILSKKLSEKVHQLEQEKEKLKEKEESLQQNLIKFQGILDNIGMGVAMIDTDMKVVELNHKMQEWFPEIDHTKTQIQCQAFSSSSRDRMCDYCPTTKTIQDGKVHEGFTKKSQKNGMRSYRILSSPIIDAQGNVTAAIEIVEDITEKVELEKKLFQSQKLEAMGKLAGGIAHDFNNILTSIIGFTGIVLSGVEEGSDAEDCLQEVYKAGIRAKELVKQILTFARQSDEELKPIQVKPLIKEVLNFLRSSIPTTIEIKQNITSNASIMGNPTQLHQVIMNLCTNSVHSMEEEGGILEVGFTDVRIGYDNSIPGLELKYGDYIKLSVSDTGTGISPEVMNSIFEPYFTTKKPGEGTGFGLSLVHGIVESLHGKIEVKSEIGKGSVFVIYLPTTKKDEHSGSYQPETLPGGSERILLIDDEAAIVKMGQWILEQLGYRVESRTSSEDALELFKLQSNDFDLIITDMTMPIMTGDKVAIEMMKIRPDIPVILFTGYSKKISVERSSEIGIKALVYKPIIKADLAKTVRKVLDEAKGFA